MSGYTLKRLLAFLAFYFISLVVTAQLRINISLHPSGGSRPVYIDISQTDSAAMRLAFTQRDVKEDDRKEIIRLLENKQITPESLVPMIKEKEFVSFRDSISFSHKKDTALFRLLHAVLANSDSLQQMKDKRFILDGMRCTLDIMDQEKTYRLEYKVPLSKNNALIHQFIKQLLISLKISSDEKIVRDFSEKTLMDYFRPEGGAYVSFGEW